MIDLRRAQIVARWTHRAALVIALAAVTTCGGGESLAPAPPAAAPSESPLVAAYLEEIISLFQAKSIKRQEIDWTALRASVKHAADSLSATGKHFDTIVDAYILIYDVLLYVDDNHSHYYAVGGLTIDARNSICIGTSTANPTVPGNIGYVRVGGFQGTDDQAVAFMSRIQDSLRAGDRDGTVGWIVDLRNNSGGNMYPMVAGLAPLLGDGIDGYFVELGGNEIPWSDHDNGAWFGDTLYAHVASPYQINHPVPRIAVLVDGLTASSGEATAISFQKRDNVRLFGSPTCGLTTGNDGYTLSDGATLTIAGAWMADRTHVKLVGPVVPDEILDPQAAPARAIAWLQTGK